ncbi:MAG: hypothetical protein ACK42H_14640 [Planctomycetota bacterium]|jgi:hypothetical protein
MRSKKLPNRIRRPQLVTRLADYWNLVDDVRSQGLWCSTLGDWISVNYYSNKPLAIVVYWWDLPMRALGSMDSQN